MSLLIKIWLSFNWRFILGCIPSGVTKSWVSVESFLKGLSLQLQFPLRNILGTHQEPPQESISYFSLEYSPLLSQWKYECFLFLWEETSPHLSFGIFFPLLLLCLQISSVYFSCLLAASALPSWLKLYTFSGNLMLQIKRKPSSNSVSLEKLFICFFFLSH